jgi:competence protein ComEA
MILRIVLAVAVLFLVVLALRHPAPAPSLASSPSVAAPLAAPAPHQRIERRRALGRSALVYVVGAVARPGLYHVGPDARAVDAVNAAGGLARDADPAGLNLAAFVRDGDELVVPVIGQSPMPRYGRTHRSRRSHARVLPQSALDLNLAGADDLAAVPGIGRAVAQRIVEMRERLGPFDSLDELLDVAGMTDERLERARPYLILQTAR